MAEVTTTVRDLRTESPSAATVRLDLGSAAFPYRPGQYITIDPHQFEDLEAEIREREAQRGKPLGPGYFSLSSDGLDPSLLEFTVKLPVDGPPAMLPKFLLAGLNSGRKVRVAGPGGKYGLPDTPPADVTGFLHVCAGSGVAPNRGMIRHALSRKWPQRHLLLVQDRDEPDALFRKEFADLSVRHKDAFRVRHFFSRSKTDRISAETIREAASEFLDLNATWAFICGPNTARPDGPGFVDRIRMVLGGELRVPPDRIRTE
jgi:ferredoxin-NADP reductase